MEDKAKEELEVNKEVKKQEKELEVKKEVKTEEKNLDNTNLISPKKQYKRLGSENKKIAKLLKKILKHIKYLDKEIVYFKKFEKKNPNLGETLDLLMTNFTDTLVNLKNERDLMEQKHLDNKISIDKLKDEAQKQ